MLRFLFGVLLVNCSLVVGLAQLYKPVDNGSTISFSIKNFGVNTSGRFTGLQGTVHFTETDPGAAVFDMSIDATTITTGIKARDSHLKKEEYFDISKFPRIAFVSKRVSIPDKRGVYSVTGLITIKGISKEINFPFTAVHQPDGILFNASFKLNRRDFKVGGSSLALADNLVVTLSLFVKKV